MKKLFTAIFILLSFWSCSNLKHDEKPCITKISYLEEKIIHPTNLPPAIQIEIKDFKKIISTKIKAEKLKSIIISSNTNERKILIPFNQEIGFTAQLLKNEKIKLTAITYVFRDTINNLKKIEIEENLNRSNIDFVFGNETLRMQKCK
jgi:hypothetical protein